MPSRDVFALDRGGFNGFLYATVGTEADGSGLTVLSALARLGEDPWAKAASWARMSEAASGAALAACITQMPVSPEDVLAAPTTAARLVRLLSSGAMSTPQLPRLRALQPRPKLLLRLIVVACTAILIGGALLLLRPGIDSRPPIAEPTTSRTP